MWSMPLVSIMALASLVPGDARASTPPGLSSLLLRQSQFADRLLAHQEFLDLAGHGHREGVDEFDVARDFVVGDLALTEGFDLVGVGVFAVAQLDPGAQFLA